VALRLIKAEVRSVLGSVARGDVRPDVAWVLPITRSVRLVMVNIGAWLVAIGIVHLALNEEDTWTVQSGRTLAGCVRSL
jgi:predicted nucleotidyltransferase